MRFAHGTRERSSTYGTNFDKREPMSLRRLAKRTRDATQSRRLLALAEVYDGGSRTDASRIGGVGLQIIRDWVLRFNARGPDGLVDGKSPGAPSKLNADHRRALAEVVEAGPVPAVDGVVRWRRKDLARWLLETFAISLDETTVGRELKALGFAKISARPRHYAQNELAVEAFKKNFPAELAKIRAFGGWRLPKGVEIELWWQDEARIGQKNKLTRRWARRGTRPRAPRDQRTEWAYIFGAICPAKGKGAGLVMPWCDTDAMAAHLIEISAAVDPGAHAVLIVDQAGWHLTPKLAIPDNITVLALPPRSPELNPVENVWQFMRDNWLSNRIFKSYDRHRRAVLPSLEQPHRPTMEDHVPRHAQMGAWVLINDRWYKRVEQELSLLNAPITYKPVSYFKLVASATAKTFVNTGEALTPYSGVLGSAVKPPVATGQSPGPSPPSDSSAPLEQWSVMCRLTEASEHYEADVKKVGGAGPSARMIRHSIGFPAPRTIRLIPRRSKSH